ncbi:hypothetical protein [Hymenobacter canadensis]|uniref:Uncharacterized protein n=1 Tax=Hymenobacter canadensis TaxID=2999067 RepID=A0ABY7LTJ3_9BACT|nr:hypothetical protein [Hymenobacter canadensis]WBA42030.1 hypothetical protein O3303_00365 [Hymenobacter canadensis]
MDPTSLPDTTKLEQHLSLLLAKMREQVADPTQQSFDSLKYNLAKLEQDVAERSYLSPLYVVNLPRWMGEYGNTALEEQIYGLSYRIDEALVELMGGREHINRIRREHNRKLGY